MFCDGRRLKTFTDSDVVMRNSGRSVFIEQRKSRPPSYQFEDENGAGRAAQRSRGRPTTWVVWVAVSHRLVVLNL
jgi:hypothetical protein